MHFCPTFHITGTAVRKSKRSKKSAAFQFSDIQGAVGKRHPDKLLLNSSFAAQLKKIMCHWQKITAIFSLIFLFLLINFDG